ncbi:MAG: DUF502 domain-containing protein [Methylophilales bacterium]|jgi:uncharacterized membrane protein|nr:DUF502 domain-containing protein [Pseudomonadota bacterium]NQW35189.1 DUF502 domain-containing protein [Methylophilales bacterium]|tara:strand:- start:2411 stop:3025 length:615 start_codon:yes stop_codon:yes gene_type:complete
MIKRNFLTGLLVLIPLMLTVWVLATLINFLDQTILLLPETLRPSYLIGTPVIGFGVFMTFFIILITGFIANNFFGKKLILLYENLLNRLPFVKSIYGGIKQVSDTLLSSSGNAFTKAVLIEFPMTGTYSFAFITGEPDEEINKKLNGKFVNVYVPTTPNPTSGYTLIVPKNKVIELDISVDQVLKYVISMGVVPVGKKLKKISK